MFWTTPNLRQQLRDLSFKDNESETLAAGQAAELFQLLKSNLARTAAGGGTEFKYVVPDPTTGKYTKQQVSKQLKELLTLDGLCVMLDNNDDMEISWN